MPILLVLLLAVASGLFIAWAFDRLAPAKGATAAAAASVEHALETVEDAMEGKAQRTWRSVRAHPAIATDIALTAAIAMILAAGVVIGLLAYLIRGNETLAAI